jgi:hypothetical protein
MFLMMSVLGVTALAAGLAAIPLVVHLLHRQKVTPIAWGAMQFLLESPLKVRRRRKIDNWLLMLVRMAILIFLAMLLARPVWRTENLTTSAPLDVAVVIDHSMTMGMRTTNANLGGTPLPHGGASAGTLFDQGVDLAERVSRMLPSSGTMCIILAENTPKVMTPTPIKMGPLARASDGTPAGEWANQLRILHGLKPGMTKGNIAPAIAAAGDVVSRGYNPRKIVLVVSDQQRTNWAPEEDSVWKLAIGSIDAASDRLGAIPVCAVPVTVQRAVATQPAGTQPGAGHNGPAPRTAANVSVRAVTVLPAFLGVHRPAQILATVANNGGIDLVSVPVVLEVDGKPVLTRPVDTLVVGDATTVRFDYYFPDPGSHWVRVRADLVDALEADNAATAAIDVKPKLPVLIVDGQLTGPSRAGASQPQDFPQAAFLAAAMQPVDPTIDPVALIEPKVISAAELTTSSGQAALRAYPIVVLNDVPRLTQALVDLLAEHAQAGNGVWLIFGPRTEPGFINDVLAKSPLLPVNSSGIVKAAELKPPPDAPARPPPSFVTVEVREPSNPAVTLLTHSGQSEHAALGEVTLRAWWQITPLSQEIRTVVATTSGDPLVAELPMGKLGGRAVVWTTSVGDLSWSNLPLVTNFVPLVNETLFHLASSQNAGQPRQVDAGQPLAWSGPAAQPIESVVVDFPDGASRTLQPELRGDHYYVEERDTALPGLYKMSFSAPARAGATAPPAAYFSVAIDREELDPAVLSPSDTDWFKGHGYLKGVITPQELPKALEATHGGLDLWWILGVLVLGFLILEILMTYRLVRQQAGETLAQEGLAMPAAVGGVK